MSIPVNHPLSLKVMSRVITEAYLASMKTVTGLTQLITAMPLSSNYQKVHTLTDTFSVQSADGTTQNITVTITGTNDVPVIGGISSGTVKEDVGVSGGNIVASGALTIVRCRYRRIILCRSK